MAEETVTVGDTEVQITETDDGFEVTETEDESEEGLYLKASAGRYGFEIPLDSEYQFVKHGSTYRFAWHPEDDISNLRSDGYEAEELDTDRLTAFASLGEPEIVEH